MIIYPLIHTYTFTLQNLIAEAISLFCLIVECCSPDESDVSLLDGRGVVNKARSPSFQPIVHFEGTVREPHNPNYDLRDESTIRERSHPKR